MCVIFVYLVRYFLVYYCTLIYQLTDIVFCEPPVDGSCSICDTIFDPRELADLIKQPVLIPLSGNGQKKKAKKNKTKRNGDYDSTPAPATPSA